MITLAMKAAEPERFSRDPLLGGKIREIFPLFFGILNTGFRLTGDYHLSALVIAIALLPIYLGLMYWLLYVFCGDAWISALVSAVSVFFIYSLFAEIWGFVTAGGAFVFLSRNLFSAFSPLLFLAAFLWRRERKVLLVFFLMGLLANLHPISGYNLVQIFALAVFLERPSLRTAGLVVLCALVFLLGASPFVVFYVQQKAAVSWLTYREMADAWSSRFPNDHVIPPFRSFLRFAFTSSALLAVGGAGMVMGWRKDYRHARFGALLLISTLAVSLLGQGVLFLLSKHLGFPLLHSAQVRAFRWLYPLLFLFASLALVSAKQLGRPKSYWLVGCLLALLVAPHLAYQPASAFGNRLLGMESRRELQLKSIAALTSRINESLQEECLFLIDPRMGRFRGLTGKSVVVTYRDAGTGRSLGPEALRLWGERYSEVSALYKNPTPEGFLALAEKYRVDYIVTEGTELELPLVVREGVFRVYDARNSVLMKDGVGGLGGQ